MSSITGILENYLRRTNSFIRFLMVGVINTLTGLSAMLLFLNLLGQSYWLSTFLGNSIGAVVSYLLNRSFTFKSTVGHQQGLYRFMIVILLCYILSYAIGKNLAVVAEKTIYFFSFDQGNLAICLGTGLYTMMNYFGQKMFVFKHHTK